MNKLDWLVDAEFDRYKNLKLQDKIDTLAKVFNSKTGIIKTSPCRGKWRGTSDVFIEFDDGKSLFIGNTLTPKAKTKRVQKEYVDCYLKQYNYGIIQVKKQMAYSALKSKEIIDNYVAANKGLKPYKLLGIELKTEQGFMGWYYVVLLIDGEIHAHLETNLDHAIKNGTVSPDFTRSDYFVAGAVKEDEVDYVFNNVGFSTVSGMYTVPLTDEIKTYYENEFVRKQEGKLCR